MFNLDDNLLTVATILKDVWGKGAGFLGSRGLGDGLATRANGLVDEAHTL